MNMRKSIIYNLLSSCYVQLFVTLWTAACQAYLSSTISQSCSNSCPLIWWCHPTISSSVTPFSSCPQSFPASGSFKINTSPNLDFPGGLDGKVSVYDAGDLGSIPGSGRFPGEGNGNPLQYSCLENPMDGGAWCRLLSMGLQRVRHDWAISLHFKSGSQSIRDELQHQSFQWIFKVDFL